MALKAIRCIALMAALEFIFKLPAFFFAVSHQDRRSVS
jgi:hypothetical protein